jgi:glutamate decarboxylase
MAIDHHKVTPFDEFNLEVLQDIFPTDGMSARAAMAIVNSEAWTDANPMLNLSSFVTTCAEPEAVEIAHQHFTKNYIDHDMYPQVFGEPHGPP